MRLFAKLSFLLTLRSALAALSEDKPSSILLGLLDGVRRKPPAGDWDGTLHLGAA